MEKRIAMKKTSILSDLLTRYEEAREVAKKAQEEKDLLSLQIQNEMRLSGAFPYFSETISLEEIRMVEIASREKISVSYEKLKVLVSQKTLDKVTTITPYTVFTVRRKKG